MDVRFINPFISSIGNVFKTMLGVDVKIGKPLLKQEDLQSADVSGVIGLSGDVQGCVVLSFSEESACKIAGTFAGMDMDLAHPDFADAVGELINMVAGNAKKDFPGVQVSISLPSVITGAGHTLSQSKASPFLVIPCQTPLGSFCVEVALIAENAQATATPATVSGAV